MKITETTHPAYLAGNTAWRKWRLAYEGGENFRDMYLQQLSTRETMEEFKVRRAISYSPTHAKAAINDIKNSIFECMSDITRTDGSKTYHASVFGESGGVDLTGSTMNRFMGCEVLPELLVMGKVGVFVDMPREVGVTLNQQGNKHPYLYKYTREQILNWAYNNPEQPTQLTNVLLEDRTYDYDSETCLVAGRVTQYRHLWIQDGQVNYQFFDVDGKELTQPQQLALQNIPFVVLELPTSLMMDVADYQIALLNIESSDINYILKANFPFYVEQYDPRTQGNFIKPANTQGNLGQAADAKSKDQEIAVGVVHGRRVPVNTTMPEFIHPSPEPLMASMQKADAIKKDIRRLVNLSVSNLSEKMASAESKKADNKGLESGLSFIGLVLEQGERNIAQHWSTYENHTKTVIVKYPEDYDARSDEERIAEAVSLNDASQKIPSLTLKKEVTKINVRRMLVNKVQSSTLDKILNEIDAADCMTSDPDVVQQDWENGFVDTLSAAKARGYTEQQVEKAKKDHADRLARIAESQGGQIGGARGIQDGQGDPKGMDGKQTSKQEKQGKQQRGPGK